MEEYKGDKVMRTLQMYAKLMDGHIIDKSEEAAFYGVNERSTKET